MSFSENLREARKVIGMSQEQLAEILDVSRQTISKWESDVSLPESAKLVNISEAIGVSIDYLMTGKKSQQEETISISSDKILIKSFDGKIVVNCIKVISSPILYPTKKEPKFILNGVDRTGLFGDHSTILAFYKDEETITKEIKEIYDVMAQGKRSYELKYFANVILKGLSPKLVK